jgi:RNA-directed DNA polymerase
MTAKHDLAGAASRRTVDWHAIEWRKAHRNVRRLQARIVKATQEGKWGKVRALQHLLAHSFSGRALAVKRVTDNRGKRTPGVDGVVWNTPAKKAQAVQSLRQRGYRPQPLRRIYIPKGNGRRRPLGIPVMADRAMQALYLLALEPIAETWADPNSYGFRLLRSPADTIEQCFNLLATRRSAGWIFEGDIRACFDRISHAWLLAHVPMDKTILRKWLKVGFMEENILYPTEEGTPQGGIISPVLANMALDGLEMALQDAFPKRLRQRYKIHLVRFADDFIIVCALKEVLEEQVKPLVEHFLAERGLELSPEKTHITHISDGFDFLGQNIRKYNDKLLIKPSRKSIGVCLNRVRAIVKANRQVTAGDLVLKLTPVLRGWANYHRHVVSKRTFQSMDCAIFKCLWAWARRRHPNKNAEWVKHKYFKTVGGCNWIFFGRVKKAKGQTQEVWLHPMAQTLIQRHTKIKAEVNPYDPAWEQYVERRLGVKMASTLRGRRTLLYLWQEQGGLCPVCDQPLTELTEWHAHHIVWRAHGGGDGTENRVLLHPNCHRQVHSQRLTVAKPRPPVRGV